jgi:hypothetical protein
MANQQHTLMRFDPATGNEQPYPSHAQQWREFNGKYAWLFNPWSGERRSAGDVGDDPLGLLIQPPGEPLYAEPQPVARVAEVHMSRYTVEWINGPLPEGTALYVR